MNGIIRNPVLRGCYPDPSCCRVGDWYYLACSSFHYWPGIPLHRSRDLVHWESIGHAIDRPEQMDLRHLAASEGLFAPTLRYHDGRFVLLCTRVAGERSTWRNFILEAHDPAGPWSDPVWIEPPADLDPGIDPSIAWDTDGTCWLHGNRRGADGQREIWLQQWDEQAQCLLGEPMVICRGSCGSHVEGPHLYHIDDRWYLLTAEGGTGPWHAVACYRSDTITGPYRACPLNPLLTHRHLGATIPITNPGHADLVRAPDGSWAALLLASRQIAPSFVPLGRETWLSDVAWEDGWPVFRPGDGQLRETMPVSWPVTPPEAAAATTRLWHQLRTPEPGTIQIQGRSVTLVPAPAPTVPSHHLTRCSEPHWHCTLRLPDDQDPDTELGILAVHNDHCQLRVTRRIVGGNHHLHVMSVDRQGERSLGHHPLPAEHPWIALQASGTRGAVAISRDGNEWQMVMEDIALEHLTPQRAGGFVGTSVGCMARCTTDRSDPRALTFPVVDYQIGRLALTG